MLRPWLLSVGVLACAASPAACGSSPATGEHGSDIIVDEGAKFVVSVEAKRIVVRKEVSGRLFPFAGSELMDKIVVMHPHPALTETGVIARVVGVEDGGESLSLRLQPLTLEEVLDLGDEDDVKRRVVTLYRDPMLPALGSAVSAPADFEPRLLPQGFSGPLLGENATIVAWAGANPYINFSGSVTPWLGDTVVKPEAILEWRKGEGLEFGAKLDFAQDFSIQAEGSIRAAKDIEEATFFSLDRRVCGKGYVALPTPLGPIPVKPAISASVKCSMQVGVRVDMTLKGKLRIAFSGSSLIRPSRDTSVRDWAKPGRWPWSASANMDVDLSGDIAPSAALVCYGPRLNVELSVPSIGLSALKGESCPGGKESSAGAGVYLSLVPATSMSPTLKAKTSVTFAVGGWGSIGKKSVGAEIALLTWKPD